MKSQMVAGLVAGWTMVAMAAEVSSVDLAIPASVKALAEPTPIEFPGGVQMAVTSTTEKAQIHVNQGMNHLHGGWEFEASRHFAAAMREDPECLLAHWGMVMCLLTPSPETRDARAAAADRLLHLAEQEKGTELENGYTYGLIKYLEEGPAGAANAFRKVARKFPNDLQAAIFAALFSRSGYDELGTAKPDQEAAEASLIELIKKHPASPLPLNALLTIRAEAPDLSDSLELARKLSQMAPTYAPYAHLLGHYQWRSGEHGRAATAFTHASYYYEKWMKDNQATVADCPEWVKSECYRIVSLASRGDFDTAYPAARKLAATPVPKGREGSPGARLLQWDAETLPARILLHRGMPGNAREAQLSLPAPNSARFQNGHSLAHWWSDGIRIALEAQCLLDEGKIDQAHQVMNAVTHHGENMAKSQEKAVVTGERSSWLRAFRAFEILASSMRGRIILAGPKERSGTAYNWFAAASDGQRPAPMMFPPMILTPMASRLGEFHLSEKQPQKAVEAYQHALTSFPNDMQSLLGLKQACLQANLTADADATQKKIDALLAN